MYAIRILLSFILLVLTNAATATKFDHGAWDSLLQKHVQMIDQGQASLVDNAGFCSSVRFYVVINLGYQRLTRMIFQPATSQNGWLFNQCAERLYHTLVSHPLPKA